MTLRARLIAAFTLLVVLVILLVGFVALRSTRQVMIDQIEDRIRNASRNDIFPALGGGGGPGGRTLAVVVLDQSGDVVRSIPSGLPGQFDPLPDTERIAPLLEQRGVMLTLPAAEGDSLYRALAVRAEDGRTYVIAHTLADVVQAQTALARRLVFGGSLVLLIGIAGVWLTVGRGLRPVDDMIDTAAAIAGGDLTKRIPEADPNSELGRLGDSLNEMLTSIETAFAEASNANSRLKQFVADASHELRTPLAAISGYAELDRRGAVDNPEEHQRVLRRIENETKRMASLVDDMMLLARLDLGRDQGFVPPLIIRAVDLAGISRDVATDHAAIDPDRRVVVGGSAPALVAGDGERLAQVVANLLANLRLHTPPTSSASIDLSETDEIVTLEYRDDGPGFPDGTGQKVFDRFYRADPSRSRKSGGSGLGLAITAAIVEAHGGSIEAHRPSGGGAAITIRLPRFSGDSQVAP